MLLHLAKACMILLQTLWFSRPCTLVVPFRLIRAGPLHERWEGRSGQGRSGTIHTMPCKGERRGRCRGRNVSFDPSGFAAVDIVERPLDLVLDGVEGPDPPLLDCSLLGYPRGPHSEFPELPCCPSLDLPWRCYILRVEGIVDPNAEFQRGRRIDLEGAAGTFSRLLFVPVLMHPNARFLWLQLMFPHAQFSESPAPGPEAANTGVSGASAAALKRNNQVAEFSSGPFSVPAPPL